MPDSLPLLIAPAKLAAQLHLPQLRIIDVGKEAIYRQAHVPGAVHLDARLLQSGDPSRPGLLPETQAIARLFSELGLTPDTHVVAYDDEGGTRAARLLWLLDAAGHKHFSYLDGGIHAWLADDLPYETEPASSAPTNYPAEQLYIKPQLDIADVLDHYQDPGVVIWDARSRDEFLGIRISAKRGGHIPGAANYEWRLAVDEDKAFRVRPLDTIRAELAALGITGDKTIITHCQTHHRSSFTWLLGKLLGFPDIRGYPGSWSEWGNREDTPVATDEAVPV